MSASGSMPPDSQGDEQLSGFSGNEDPCTKDVGSYVMGADQISEAHDSELSGEELANRAWEEVTAEFESRFEIYWPLIAPDYALDFPDPDYAKLFAMTKEKSFFIKVYAANREMAVGHEGPITNLFDVDRTIRENGYDNTATAYMTRPAFPLVIRKLIEDLDQKIEVGLLSNIPQAKLDEQLQDQNKLEYPQYMACLPPGILQPDFVISSRSLEQAIPSWKELLDSPDENLAQKSNLVGDIVAPIVLKKTEQGFLKSDEWYDAKLAIIHHLIVTNPTRNFVYIDDLLSAKAIDPRHSRIRGVYVGLEVHDTTESEVARDIINEQRF